MLYAILAYHVEAHVMSWTKQEDESIMSNLRKAHDRLNQVGRLGPAARLGATNRARTLRGPGNGTVVDGPFAETKEQLAGYYMLDCPNLDDAIEWAARIPTACKGGEGCVEIRPLPGIRARPETEAAAGHAVARNG